MLQEQLELENACALTNALEIKDGAFEEPLNATTSLSRDSSTEVQRRIPPPWSHRATALSHKDACLCGGVVVDMLLETTRRRPEEVTFLGLPFEDLPTVLALVERSMWAS